MLRHRSPLIKYKKMKLKHALIPLLLLFLAASCTKEEIAYKEVEEIIVPTIINIEASDIEANSTKMFTDADNNKKDGKIILYNDDLRSFYVNEMLEIKAIEGNKFRIRNFLPYTFENLEVFVSTKGLDAPIKIAKIEKIPALSWYETELPFTEKEMFFEDKNNNIISVEKFDKIMPKELKISLEGEDPMLKKVKSIILKTRYTFRHYNEPGKWDTLYASDARNYLPLIFNMAYIFSSDDFENDVKNAPYDFKNNDKVLDKDAIVKGYRSIALQRLGIVIKPGLGGLGGGATFGIRREYMDNSRGNKDPYYTPIDLKSSWARFPLEAWIHEFGHVVGYGHNGNMTYFGANKDGDLEGLPPIVMSIYQKMLKSKELPFTKYPYNKTSSK